ncbi:MAG: hypothetical protein ACJAWT_000757 [Glaciecola sp.]|jgi:hypothetical protein
MVQNIDGADLHKVFRSNYRNTQRALDFSMHQIRVLIEAFIEIAVIGISL